MTEQQIVPTVLTTRAAEGLNEEVLEELRSIGEKFPDKTIAQIIKEIEEEDNEDKDNTP